MTANIVSNRGIPNNWSERENLRNKGQFWTPDWVAKAMVTYVIGASDLLFDPAFGRGAFYFALRSIAYPNKEHIGFHGIDIDNQLVDEARNMYSGDPSFSIEQRDFITDPPKRLFKSIVANPPYIRHHRLSTETKDIARRIALRALGRPLDGRAGIHIYFLIQALGLLEYNGKLAFIMPSDTCEGVFADELWRWITENYCLESVITFRPEATPFPAVDTNAIIFLIKKAEPAEHIFWIQVNQSDTEDLTTLVASGFGTRHFTTMRVVKRRLQEAIRTGLSRGLENLVDSRFTLSHFASVMRGIATGSNDFFFMTREEANRRSIPAEFLELAVGRTRDVDGFYITDETMHILESKGRPTLLFSPDGRMVRDFPPLVQEYLHIGEDMQLPQKPLISSRNPWYKMEQRTPPPFLFAYLGRRNARFIRNLAGVVPLTGFLCVYPVSNSPAFIGKLWHILQSSETIANLASVGKSYGSGAIKVEPRALERLPLPESLAAELDATLGEG